METTNQMNPKRNRATLHHTRKSQTGTHGIWLILKTTYAVLIPSAGKG